MSESESVCVVSEAVLSFILCDHIGAATALSCILAALTNLLIIWLD